MSAITFPYPPGFADVPDGSLAAEQFAQGILLGRIAENAAMGMVRPEVFFATYKHGDTVVLPKSDVDGYVYSRDELNYMWGVLNLDDSSTGQISQNLPWAFGQWFVNQDTGEVTIEKYYSNDSGSKQQKTNDGQLFVYTIGQRKKTSMYMSLEPWYEPHADSDYQLDTAMHTTPLTDLSRNAKFSIVNSEAIYMGTYKSTQKVALPVSPVDGYAYSQSEVIWLWSWVWNSQADSFVNPLSIDHHLTQMHQMRASVAADGTVSINVHFYNDHDIDMGDAFGRIAVTALCQRSGTATLGFIKQIDLTKNFGDVFGYYTCGARAYNFQLNSPLPGDAVITGIYPTLKATASGGYQVALAGYGDDLAPLDINVSATEGNGLTIDGTRHYAASIGTDISRMSHWQFICYVCRSLVGDGAGSAFIRLLLSPAMLSMWDMGYAIYYTSSSPTTDTILDAPFAVPAGSGLAWAIPTAATNDGTAIDDGTYKHIIDFTKNPVTRGTAITIPTSPTWNWVDPADLAAGKPLRENLFKQINDNANVACLRPEFFDMGDFANGATVPLPVSSVDGYTYTRDEIVYLWEMGDTGTNTSGNIRIVDWKAFVYKSGLVSINMLHLRDGGHQNWDNEGTLRVKAIGFRTSAIGTGIPTTPWSDPVTSADVGPTTIQPIDNFSIVGQSAADGWSSADTAGTNTLSSGTGISGPGASQSIAVNSGAGNSAGIVSVRQGVYKGDRYVLSWKAKSNVAITTGWIVRLKFWNSDASASVYADIYSGSLGTGVQYKRPAFIIPTNGDTQVWSSLGRASIVGTLSFDPSYVSVEFLVYEPDATCTVLVDDGEVYFDEDDIHRTTFVIVGQVNVANDVGSPYSIRDDQVGVLDILFLTKTAPTAPVIFDIKRVRALTGTVSILSSTVTIPAGSTADVLVNTFPAGLDTLLKDDKLRLDVLNGIAADMTIIMRWR